MSRTSIALLIVLLILPFAAFAQTRDPQIEQLKQEAAQLKKTVADQERRIAELETTVKALEAIVNPLPAPLPRAVPLWHQASNWNQIKLGMSEAEVTQILGPPTNVQSVNDVRTLFYQPDPRSTTTLNGSVTLTDDRVTASTPPAF